jgi:calcium-dependent protein kinase
MLKVAAECHLHGLVHRDMKPENFLFKSTKEDSPLKATDFGLSDFIKPGIYFKSFCLCASLLCASNCCF